MNGQLVCDCGCETMRIYINTEPIVTRLAMECTACDKTMVFTALAHGDEPASEEAP